MALTAALAIPKSPEMWPTGGGRLSEVWRLTGDASDVEVTITSNALRRITACIAGIATHNITSSTTNSVTLTFATAPGDGLTLDVLLIGVQ